MTRKTVVLFGIVLMTAGPIAIMTRRHWVNTRTTTALSMPISPTATSVTSPEFKVNMDHPYEVSVQFQRPYPRILEDCVSGPREELYNCNKSPLLKAHWRVWSGGRVAAQGIGDSDNSFPPRRWLEYGSATCPFLKRTVGYFNSESGRPYVLDVHFAGDLAQLADAQPYLVVAVPVTYDEERDIEMTFLFILSGVGVVVGLVTVIFGAASSLARNYFR